MKIPEIPFVYDQGIADLIMGLRKLTDARFDVIVIVNEKGTYGDPVLATTMSEDASKVYRMSLASAMVLLSEDGTLKT